MKSKLIQKISSTNFDLGACAAFHNLFTVHHFSNEKNKLEIFAIFEENKAEEQDKKDSSLGDGQEQQQNPTLSGGLEVKTPGMTFQKLRELDEVKLFCIVPLSTLFEERNLVICIMNDNSKKLVYISRGIKSTSEYNVKDVEDQIPSSITDLLDSECLMSSCSSGYFSFYSPQHNLLQIIRISMANQGLVFDKIADIDIFSKKAYSLQLTHSHVVLGQLNSIQLCDWRYQQIKQNNSDNSNSNLRTTGRIIYLPKVTKTTKKKAKQGITTEKNGLLVPKKEGESATAATTSTTSESTTNTQPSTTSEKPILVEETISTISKQRDEKVKDVKSLSNNSFIILSSLGNLYLLNCLMPNEGDVFVKLSLPITNEKLSKITSFDVLSTQLEPLYNPSLSGLLVLAFENSDTIVVTSLKPIYSYLQTKQSQPKEPSVIDIGIDNTIFSTDIIHGLCLSAVNNLVVSDKKEILMYQII